MARHRLVYQFRVTLVGIAPSIWRRIQVPANYSFWDLHVALQDSMGWLDYHLHAFRVKKPKGRSLVEIGIPDDETDRSVLPGWEIAVANYMGEPGATAIYEYDFGDGWEHELLLEGLLLGDTETKYPVCVAGEGACPPEDCGGIPGFAQLLEILDQPGTDEYESMATWLKGHAKNYWPYEPRHFDPREVQFWDPKKRWRIAFGKGGGR